LKKNNFSVEMPCKRLPGTSEKNIVNKAIEKGVQLEITLNLMNQIDKDRDKLIEFSKIIKESLNVYLKQN